MVTNKSPILHHVAATRYNCNWSPAGGCFTGRERRCADRRGMWEPLSPNRRIRISLPKRTAMTGGPPRPPTPSLTGVGPPHGGPIHQFKKKEQTMAKQSLDELIMLNDTELETRAAAAYERVQTRIERAQNAGRDLTQREADLTRADRDELGLLKDAIEIRAARREEGDRIEAESRARAKQLGDAIDAHKLEQRPAFASGRAPSLLVSETHLRAHANAMAQGQPYGAIEARAAIQIDPAAANTLGSPSAWAQTGPRDPRHLVGYSGIPVQQLTGSIATVPQFVLPTGAAGVAETASHPEYDSVVDVQLTAVRHGRWSKVTAAVNAFDPLVGLSNAHAIGIARNLDLAAVGDIEDAAGAPLAYNSDVAGNVRLAINLVAATIYSQVEDLVIVGTPSDVAKLQDVTPASGTDAGSVTARFSGARLYPSTAASAGQLTVFAPAAFVTFMSGLQSASQINPQDGSNSFGSWIHATGVALGLVGGAVAVDTTTP